eukprot:gb/GECG01006453.1/.p1 GENE.gb/GECG01006453.1/~~gb/GECG01006453.1/.p1  ORF type:complete len:355 (+),score=104.08 gb/GECG01006453.1/:1-1065(+)
MASSSEECAVSGAHTNATASLSAAISSSHGDTQTASIAVSSTSSTTTTETLPRGGAAVDTLDAFMDHFGGVDLAWQAAAEILVQEGGEEESADVVDHEETTYEMRHAPDQPEDDDEKEKQDGEYGNQEDGDDVGSHSSEEHEDQVADECGDGNEGYMYMGLISGQNRSPEGILEEDDGQESEEVDEQDGFAKESFGSMQSASSGEDFEFDEEEAHVPYYTLGEEPLITPSEEEANGVATAGSASVIAAAYQTVDTEQQQDNSNKAAAESTGTTEPIDQNPAERHTEEEEEHFDPFEDDTPSAAWNPPMTQEKREKIKGIMAKMPPPPEAYSPGITMTVQAIQRRAQKNQENTDK